MKIFAGIFILLLAVGCGSLSPNVAYQELPLWQSQEIKLDGPPPENLADSDLQEILLSMARIPGMNRHKVRFTGVTEDRVTVFAQPLPGNGVPVSQTYKTRKLDFQKEKGRGWIVMWVSPYLD
jgi:hypothetical protein